MVERNEPCWCGSGKKYKKCHLSSDQEKRTAPPPPLSQANQRGAHIRKPDRKHIKNAAQIAWMRSSGAFNGILMDYIRPYVKAGVSTEELDKLVHGYTTLHGHTPACLGYEISYRDRFRKVHRVYKKSCCISRNDVVCHGIPSPNEIITEGDIVNVDLTTIVGGYHGDSSETFEIGKVTPEASHLVQVAARALIIGIEAVRPGAPLAVIGETVEPFVNKEGCSVVQSYTGHGIGAEFHEHFSVYHHIEDKPTKDTTVIMAPGMTFTIEPMINLGDFEVTTDEQDGWTVRTADGSLSAQFEHTILVTESGADILTLTPSQKSAGIRLHAAGVDYR
ncbi:MAG: type I methionyl aminopeptidase [Chitinispirillia bacterium]|nr:type I methionyl aminopeptidase [Chitinispirillia bacterium]MCL2242204.1 type I methionyl aminopeptidase [Chitinispirillia bacterium]